MKGWLLVLALLATTRAYADDVDKLVGQLQNDGSDKVRLAAAVNLAKLADKRAVFPFIKCVNTDSDANTREACALGLGVVGNSAAGSAKGLIIKTLQQVAQNDSSSNVQAQANASLKQLGQSGGGGAVATSGANNSGAGGAYINVGGMSVKLGGSNDAKLKAIMARSASAAMSKFTTVNGKPVVTSWPNGGTPTAADLNKKQVAGFYVDGTLSSATANVSGGSATISCKVSMLLATFPDKNIVANLNGGASVQGGSSPRDQAGAQEDCVQAVVEDLIAKRIVPTIKSKVP